MNDEPKDLAEAVRGPLNKAEILELASKHKVKDINAAIKSLRAEATELRRNSGDLYVTSDYLADEVRRRAEQMERRIDATTDDDYK